MGADINSSPAPVAAPGRGPLAYIRRHPIGFWFIFWGELAERCAFYGIRTLLFVYLTTVLGFADAYATQVSRTYLAGCYLSPLLGGFLADRFLGKYWVIVGFSIPYVFGMLLMGVGSEYAVYGGLALLALGSGAVKPNISTLMGLTYDEKRPGDTKIRGDAFYMYYFAINLGAVISSFLLPVVAKKDGLFEGNRGYFVGFMITAALMALALTLFSSGKRYYAHEQVRKQPPQTPEQRAEQWKVLSRIGGLFLLVALWWCAYDMKSDVWIAFTRDHVELQLTPTWTLLPNQLIALNPFLILILVPILNIFWKVIDKSGERFPAPRKMLVGFLLMCVTYVVLAIAGSLTGDGHKVSILWMVAAFVVMTISEVMVSVIGLELAFRAAPPRLKSLVTACWFLSVFAGNLLAIPIAKQEYYQKFGPGPFFAGFAAMMVLASVGFYFVGKRFQRNTE